MAEKATVSLRGATKYALDVLVWTALTPLAFALRLDGEVGGYTEGLVALTAVGFALKMLVVPLFGLHRRAWRWASVGDLLTLAAAVTLVTTVLAVAAAVLRLEFPLPRSVPFIEGVLAILALSGLRLGIRVWHESVSRRNTEADGRRVLVVGAGNAGVMVVREMLRHPDGRMIPVGFLDDDPVKRRQRIAGRRVLGRLDQLAAVVRLHAIDEVLIAIPSAGGDVARRVVTAAREAGVKSRTLPPLFDLVSGRVAMSQIREVDLDDLLRRDPIRLDADPIRAYIEGRRVLVTGAGGSIGSEIVRQIAPFRPSQIVLLGRGENSVYLIDREMGRRWPDVPREPVICDVRDKDSLQNVFDACRPEVVFHAAAHKHVPLMEANPSQAVWNNVGGTQNLVLLAAEFGVERLVNVSTDKAVNPTNVMGASKRVAEMIVSDVGRQCAGACTMASVRFGNVLGSRGSVVPLFRDQIRRGGPVTVTHPDMVRYFMTIPEAAQLVLQAGSYAESGSVYVLDMGKPVKIADLARDLILLSGLEPGKDIEIQFTGARPGEKLFEELLTAEEGTKASQHDKIFVARKGAPPEDLNVMLGDLFACALDNDHGAIREAFERLVPSYKPNSAVPAGEGRAAPIGDGAVEQAELFR
ncbi:MAG: nucleoside-diphosphate sugar epimerase/dehydratase [Bacteroidota bacterium]